MAPSSPTPRIAVFFEVIFDQKVGYTLSWSRTLAPTLSLSGIEFKSLPSGLHGVQKDWIYFTHGGQGEHGEEEEYVGLSVFVQGEADASQRNVSFVAVGVLVKRRRDGGGGGGGLGRTWELGERLEALAHERVGGRERDEGLRAFWEEFKGEEEAEGEEEEEEWLLEERGAGRQPVKARPQPSEEHPALCMETTLDRLGPLLFPVYRAALLRKRLLFLGTTPVRDNCELVYILSALASLPSALSESLPSAIETASHLRPLFNVGIHDIPLLESMQDGAGWLACSTDDILRDKKRLHDVVVELGHGPETTRHRWPRISTSDGRNVKSTQRDLRRYRSLRSELRRMRLHGNRAEDTEECGCDRNSPTSRSEEGESIPLMQNTTNGEDDEDEALEAESDAVEPVSWTATICESFMWWASAGDQEAFAKEERDADTRLLNTSVDPLRCATASSEDDYQTAESREMATAVVAYFRNWTVHMLQTLATMVEEADSETGEGIEEHVIEVSSGDLRTLGLDPWSENDRIFVQEAIKVYFKRDASVSDEGVRMCGVRLC